MPGASTSCLLGTANALKPRVLCRRYAHLTARGITLCQSRISHSMPCSLQCSLSLSALKSLIRSWSWSGAASSRGQSSGNLRRACHPSREVRQGLMADHVGIRELINSATNSGDARMRLLERRFTGELPLELPSPKSLTFEAHNVGHRRAGAQPDQAGTRGRACLETGASSSCRARISPRRSPACAAATARSVRHTPKLLHVSNGYFGWPCLQFALCEYRAGSA